jgi:luciferase family oxidoreductase group 1
MVMRLSVLDQSPVPSGSTAAEALQQSVALAQAAEQLGYHRYWLAEHHGAPGLAGTAPEVLAARVAAATSTIRVGAGGILLSHYSPLKVAETFRVLTGLFPGRIDLGIGRAEGASAGTTTALQAGAAQAGLPFGQKLGELLDLLDARDKASGGERPEVWLLASSSEGAAAAADLGLPLCFAHFISWGFAAQIVRRYQAAFRPAAAGQEPRASAAVAVICADTNDDADRLASSVDIWRLASEEDRGPVPSPDEAWARGRTQLEAAQIKQRRQGLIVGDPDRVAASLSALAAEFGVDELVLLTICHDQKARLRSYELLAEAFDL